MYYLGIDPGNSSGGAALLNKKGAIVLDGEGVWLAITFKNKTEHELDKWFFTVADDYSALGLKAALEKVRSRPGMGAPATFTFGWNYGFLRGMLAAYSIPYVEPTPQVWMKKLSCMTGGDKNVSKRKAHERWPKQAGVITKDLADALLIAEWLRLTELGR